MVQIDVCEECMCRFMALENKGTLDTLKEYHSVAGRESSLQPLAGSKKSSYMRSPLEPPGSMLLVRI